jgi:transcriptional regulator NrdR family protein
MKVKLAQGAGYRTCPKCHATYTTIPDICVLCKTVINKSVSKGKQNK